MECQITDISYTSDRYISDNIEVQFAGRLLYYNEQSNGHCSFYCKLLDNAGAVVESKLCFSPTVSVGELWTKKSCTVTFFNLEPGMVYTMELVPYNS